MKPLLAIAFFLLAFQAFLDVAIIIPAAIHAEAGWRIITHKE